MKSENITNSIPQKSGETGRFARNIIWAGLAQLFNTLIFAILTMPALTKFYRPEVYGIWVQVDLTVGVLSPFLALQLGQAIIRYLSGEEDQVRRKQMLGTVLWTISLVCFIALIIANWLAEPLSNLFFASPAYTVFIRLTFLWILISAIFNCLVSYLFARKNIRLASILQVVLAAATITAVIVMARMSLGLEWIIGVAIALQSIVLVVMGILVVKETGFPLPRASGLKEYLAFSVPQMPGAILLWIIRSSDRFFITHFLSLTQTGIYNSSNTLGSLASLFYMPISMVLFPLVSRLWEEKRYAEVSSYLEYSVRVFLTLAIPAALAVTVLSQPLLKVLTTAEFLAGWEPVLLISVGSILMGIYQINVNILLLVKRTRVLPLIIAAASATSLIANVVLIPRIGILGAAFSNVAAYCVLAVIVIVLARKYVQYRLDLIYVVKVVIAALVMAAVLYFCHVEGIPGVTLAVIGGVLIYGGVLWALRAFTEKDRKLVEGLWGR